MKKILYLVFSLAGFINLLNAQITETYFYDDEVKSGGTIESFLKNDNHFIIAGKVFDKYKYMPYISKIDTLGNLVWTTTTFDGEDYSTLDYYYLYVPHLIQSDSYIYALPVYNVLYDEHKLWKINASTGQIEWKKTFNNWDIKHMLDIDNDKLLFCYFDNYNASTHTTKFSVIDKNTGNVISTHFIGNSSTYSSSIGLGIDSQKNIYYTINDSIYKVSAYNLDNVLWSVSYSGLNIDKYEKLYVDQNDNIFVVGASNYHNVRVLSFDKNNGNLIWNTPFIISDVRFRDLLDKNGHLYFTWQHSYVGGSISRFNYTKIEKTTGNIAWSSAYYFSGTGTSVTCNGQQAALSLDMDNNGDLYLTGYYGSSNYGPANWGVLKLDGATGNPLYEKTITENIHQCDAISMGQISCVIDNKAFFLGQLQDGNKFRPTLVKLNKNTGDVLLKKSLGKTHQFPSRTIQIKKYGTDKTLVLKQVGLGIEVDMYDFDKNLLWTKRIEKNYILFGDDISVNGQGRIFVSAHSAGDDDVPPFYQDVTEKIYGFVIEENGDILNEFSRNINSDVFNFVDIIHDSQNSYLFYCKQNELYAAIIDSDGFVQSTTNLNIPLSYCWFPVKMAYNHSSSDIFLFVSNKIYSLNKTTLSKTLIVNFPSSYNLYNFKPLGNDDFLIAGNLGNSNHDIMKYNVFTNQLYWTNNNPDSLEGVTRMIIDSDSTNVYAIGLKNYNGIITKINMSTGDEVWTNQYFTGSSEHMRYLNFTYDKYRDQLSLVGYKTHNYWGKDVYFQVIDTSGTELNTTIMPGDFDGDSVASCAQVLNDGSVWIGGNINLSDYGLAGFIFEIAPTNPASIENDTGNSGSNPYHIKVYPVPSGNKLNLEYQIIKSNSDVSIELYDMIGKIVYSNNLYNQKPEIFHVDIDTKDLKGIYFLKVRINNNISVHKIISR